MAIDRKPIPGSTADLRQRYGGETPGGGESVSSGGVKTLSSDQTKTPSSQNGKAAHASSTPTPSESEPKKEVETNKSSILTPVLGYLGSLESSQADKNAADGANLISTTLQEFNSIIDALLPEVHKARVNHQMDHGFMAPFQMEIPLPDKNYCPARLRRLHTKKYEGVITVELKTTGDGGEKEPFMHIVKIRSVLP